MVLTAATPTPPAPAAPPAERLTALCPDAEGSLSEPAKVVPRGEVRVVVVACEEELMPLAAEAAADCCEAVRKNSCDFRSSISELVEERARCKMRR